MQGLDGLAVQKLLGHKTASMTSRYAHLSPAFLKGATEKLDAAFVGLLPKTTEAGAAHSRHTVEIAGSELHQAQ
jgi:hypothetical protein